MATEEKKILFKIEVDDNNVVKSLTHVSDGFIYAEAQGRKLDNTLKSLSNSGYKRATIEVNKFTAAIKKETTAAKTTEKANKDLAKATDGVAKSSGAAAATTLELGRVISDAPYGIRGMANNVSQVASQMAFMSRSTDAVTGKVLGFGGALKLIKAQIMGPLGILLGIQAVIAALDFFAGGMKKAEDTTEDFDAQIKKLNKSLRVQKGLLEDSPEALENYNSAIKEHIAVLAKQKELEELDVESKEKLLEINKILSLSDEETAAQIREIAEISGKAIGMQESLTQAKAYRITIEQKQVDVFDKLNRKQQEAIDIEEKWKQGMKTTVPELKSVISYLKNKRDTLSETSEEYALAGVEIEEYENKLLNLTGQLNEVEKAQRKVNRGLSDDRASALEDIGEAESEYLVSLMSDYEQEKQAIRDKYFYLLEQAAKYGQDQLILIKARQKEIDDIEIKGAKKTRATTKRTYKEALLNLEKFILRQLKLEEQLLERNERERLLIKQKYAVKDIQLTHDTWVENEKLRLKNFENSKATEAEKLEAKKISNAAVIQAEVELGKAVIALKGKQTAELSEFDRVVNDRQIQDDFELREKRIGHLKTFYDEVRIERDNERIRLQEERIAEAERLSVGLKDDELFQAEMAISKLRMELETQELDHTLMVIEAKKNAQMEYANYMAGIGGIMTQIAGKNKELAIASLLVTKGAAIAQVVIGASASIAQQTAATSAALSLESKNAALLGPVVGIPYLAGKTALLSTQLTGGIAATKTTAGISIASILASTISSFSTPKGGSGGGGGGGGGAASQEREFDFNLVGNTGVNQLAQGIGSQFDQPIQAYVVGSQITSQQQLDATIQSNASIG